MATITQPVAIVAGSEMEATRKAQALAKISNLSPTSLAAIAKAAEKKGADARLAPYLKFL